MGRGAGPPASTGIRSRPARGAGVPNGRLIRAYTYGPGNLPTNGSEVWILTVRSALKAGASAARPRFAVRSRLERPLGRIAMAEWRVRRPFDRLPDRSGQAGRPRLQILLFAQNDTGSLRLTPRGFLCGGLCVVHRKVAYWPSKASSTIAASCVLEGPGGRVAMAEWRVRRWASRRSVGRSPRAMRGS